jgi:sialate O-acetylesterase
MHRKFALGLAALGLALAARGDVSLAPLFRDHAVVQRDQPLVVWGWADPDEPVTVAFRGHSAAVTTSRDGNWRVALPAPAASAEPAEIRVQGRNALVVHDVLVGDVWLASGQSNMEWRVDQAADAEKEIAAARHPLIRHFDVPNLVTTEPRRTADGEWTVCSPATVANYSAVAYYFARDWHAATGVPVGIVNATWGGTPVEAWMSAATLASRETFKPALARWQQTLAEYPVKKAEYDAALARWEKGDAAAAGEKAKIAYRRENPKPRAPRGPGHHWTPAGLYNGMIAPLVPFPLAGAIWYQAESNADYPADYGPLFTAMIQQWRAEWGREFPFYFVQIANFQGTATDRQPGQWAWLREAQAQALALPKTGMAVTIDIGTPRNIHPKNKQEVGRRLALVARRDLLGAQEEASGPVLKEAITMPGGFRLVFTHAAGLESDGRPLTGFEIAGADRKFFPAQARIERGEVVVTSAEVPQPVAVRYAWANAPEARLRNAAQLPAAPFRTDRWPQP